MFSKAELRRSHLKTRQSLSVQAWKQKSDRLCTHIQHSPLFTQAQTILAYFTYRQEPDLTPLFTIPKKWGFPRCSGNQLSWHNWTPGDNLQTGKFGILEPYPDSPILEPSAVDLILVPAVACDTQGYRLGYGGGYYDRMLSLPEWASKPAIGIIFEFACLAELPIDSWDRPLHGFCTETGLIMVQKRAENRSQPQRCDVFNY
ncbi:5-formyltetrahydrofolate cyclo-ligase [Kamptonema sp. UHCC 0994]|uniref:5-formyltetrahydrofolate cyclo-ligase n=1 Tax=Kamptonema sp. UHCC 0994 TaxID=3031329 RepID=UPI0023B990DD|nr:5-formyltetrahydrofolate cyclo-ligase [Kamptonema sp. UHCC 0994]MDF0551544.1 5-formyltetrahydrofolate cyclo-ligase [Kamptonema sp. UHCC 0994]